MNTGLSDETTQTIINLGHVFDWHGYARTTWVGRDDAALHAEMGKRVQQMKTTSKLSVRAEENFAVNAYLHRNFHHGGHPPEANTEYWFDMLFLYLHLYRLPVPLLHRHSLHTSWASRAKGAAESAAAEIRQVLRRTQIT